MSAHKDNNSTVTVTEIGDGVEIQWTTVRTERGRAPILCASITAHNFKDNVHKRRWMKPNKLST